MKLTVQDLAMFIGCECEVEYRKYKKRTTLSAGVLHYSAGYREIKLILRPLSDMTEEDRIQLGWDLDVFNYTRKNLSHKTIHLHPDEFRYLMSKGFDLCGLIEKGLAIDKTKISQVTK